MFKKLRTYFREGFGYTGIELVEKEGKAYYFVLNVKQHKGELVVVDQKEADTFDKLASILPKGQSLFLSINTTHVLTKHIEGAVSNTPAAVVNHAFPNLDPTNFYFEVVENEGNPLVTIAKKEPIDQVLSTFAKANIKINHFSLGVSGITNILTYLANQEVNCNTHLLTSQAGSLSRLTPKAAAEEQHYDLNGLRLSSSYLLGFSQIIGHLNQRKSHTNFEEQNESLKWSFKNHRIFNLTLRYALLFFILLLLGNFFVYNFYHEKVGTLNAAMAATSSQKDGLTLLDETVRRKQERVETLTASANSKATYFLDLFAQQIPSSILLNEIKYQPLAKPVRENKPIMLEERQLLVSGISKDVNDFSFWIEALEKFPWVASVETLDFDYINKDSSNFLIEIGLHEDR